MPRSLTSPRSRLRPPPLRVRVRRYGTITVTATITASLPSPCRDRARLNRVAQTSLLSSLKGHMSELGSSHSELQGAVSKSIGAAGGGGGGGGWMSLGSFVVFQALFTAVFLFYKRYVDSNKDKLF